MNCWPSATASRSEMIRAWVSVLPPAVKGTITLTGRCGQVWAWGSGAASVVPIATQSTAQFFIDLPPTNGAGLKSSRNPAAARIALTAIAGAATAACSPSLLPVCRVRYCNMARMHSIPRRRVIAGMAAFGLWGLAPKLPAAESGASKSPARPLADRLAAYADGLRHDDLDAATLERVKSHFIDTIGCGIAAFDERPVRICRDVALGTAGGAATVIGTNRRTTPDLAPFANGAALRYHTLNDSYVGGLAGHPSDHIAASPAVAKSEHASAAELITAIVLP